MENENIDIQSRESVTLALVDTPEIAPEGVSPEGVSPEVSPRKSIALVAHDHKKADLLEWARYNRELLIKHDLYATGTTGRLLGQALDTPVTCLQSGPLGGDQQIGSRIAEGKIDLLIFFWDPLEQQPHDTDVKALLRIAVVWNIPVACDRATADYIISSPLMTGTYERQMPDYSSHIERFTGEKTTIPAMAK
ncbi:MAG: methylglyoxal synthase [Anaerolineaceae bacterium]|nr:methylglyoxal synthase [Anaerolineaceae bacterium]